MIVSIDCDSGDKAVVLAGGMYGPIRNLPASSNPRSPVSGRITPETKPDIWLSNIMKETAGYLLNQLYPAIARAKCEIAERGGDLVLHVEVTVMRPEEAVG